MKYLFFILMILAFTSCKRDKFYSCICYYKNDSLEVYRVGRMNEAEAYATCRTYADSTTSCLVEIRK